jgi:putative transposase
MPRPPRISFPGILLHVVQRGNNRNRTFFDDEDRRTYLLLLRRISERYETSIHAYVLMSNHVHLLMTSGRKDGIALTMQQLGSSYARHVNKRYGRTGTLWEGRYRSAPVDSDFYCLACYRYIELNPVRAGIVSRPEDYRWSSHRENIGRRALSIVKPHASFLAIAASSDRRVQCYRELFSEQLPETTLKAIRGGTCTSTPVGSEQFQRALEKRSGSPIASGKRGRPLKNQQRQERGQGPHLQALSTMRPKKGL